MKYDASQLAAMASVTLQHYPIYASRSLNVNAMRAQQVVNTLQIRFGCSENYVLKQLEQMAGPFNRSHTTNTSA